MEGEVLRGVVVDVGEGHEVLEEGIPADRPESWADDRDRCRDATVPDDRKFRTKARLAQGMRQPRAWLGVVLAPDGADEDPRFPDH